MPSTLPKNGGPGSEDPQEAPTGDLAENEADSISEEVDEAEENGEVPTDVPEKTPETNPETKKGEKGIQETLEVLDAVGAGMGIAPYVANGDWIGAVSYAVNSMPEYGEALEEIEEVPAEVGDLDAEEAQEVAQKALDLANEVLSYVEAA